MARGAKAARGDCGGPFTPALVQIEGEGGQDPDGVWEGVHTLADGRIAISADWTMKPSAPLRGLVFTSCPVAACEGPAVGEAFRLHRAVERHTLPYVEPNPSAAAMEAVDVVALALAEMRDYEADARRQEREAQA